MYCKRCGHEMENGADFCSQCGAKIEDSNAESSDIQQSSSDRMANKIIPILLSVTGLLLIILVVIVYCSLKNRTTENDFTIADNIEEQARDDEISDYSNQDNSLNESSEGAEEHTHQWIAATCTEPKTCSECGATEGEPLGHTWIDATCTEPQMCSVCGETQGNPIDHQFDASHRCIYCGKVSYQVGDIITFGTYEQDNDTLNGMEPIEWIVLDVKEGKALLLSHYVLDDIVYDDRFMGSEPYDASNVVWENCTCREWLNSIFYNTAFSSDEKEQIIETVLHNYGNREYGTDGGNDTTDKLFFLSLDEVNEYFDFNYFSDQKRTGYPTGYSQELLCEPTLYARTVNNGSLYTCYIDSEKYSDPYTVNMEEMGYSDECIGMTVCYWMLRTPGKIGNQGRMNVCYVSSGGSAGTSCENGVCVYKYGGVRPAMWISL